MVDARSKASKWKDKGKCRAVEDLPVEHDNSPTLSSGENSIDRPPVSQFVITKQLGETLKQVQEAVIQGMCETMKALECLDPCGGLSMSLPLDIHLHISKTVTVPFKQNQALLEESLKLSRI